MDSKNKKNKEECPGQKFLKTKQAYILFLSTTHDNYE